MKKSAFILTIMLSALLSSMLKAQESTDYIYYPTHLWLNYKPQTINTPLINKGADIAGNTFSVKDFSISLCFRIAICLLQKAGRSLIRTILCLGKCIIVPNPATGT